MQQFITRSSHLSQRTNIYSYVSPAYIYTCKPCLRAMFQIGDEQIVKNCGSRTDPWGTPKSSGRNDDKQPLMLTACVRSDKHERIHSSALPLTPKVQRCKRRIPWSMASKAAEGRVKQEMCCIALHCIVLYKQYFACSDQ